MKSKVHCYISKKNEKVPTKVPTKLTVYLRNLYSEPKIYIPKKESGKPTLDKHWYVYYYFRNPATLKMCKHIEKQGVNREKSITSRRKKANILRVTLKELLQNGFNPYKEYVPKKEVETTIITTKSALENAFNGKTAEWKESTLDSASSHYRVFIKWLKKQRLIDVDIKLIRRKNIVDFLDYLITTKKVSNTTRNNYMRTLSSVFTKMIEYEYIDINIVKSVAAIKSNPKKNKPLSIAELKKAREYLLTNDQYLHKFIKFVAYGFFRPVEVCRIKIEDIDLHQKIIYVDTKTNENYIPIIDTLRKVIEQMNIEKYKPTDFLFTKFSEPSEWNTKLEKSKTKYFYEKFIKLQKEIGLKKDKTIYSFRHNAALNLYHSFVAGGLQENQAVNKLQKIMRHKNAETTRIYLRGIGAFAVADYSGDYTFEF